MPMRAGETAASPASLPPQRRLTWTAGAAAGPVRSRGRRPDEPLLAEHLGDMIDEPFEELQSRLTIKRQFVKGFLAVLHREIHKISKDVKLIGKHGLLIRDEVE